MSLLRRLVLVALLGLLALAPPALSLTVNEVAREVRCPTCNTPLDVSSAPVALRMKSYIADRIAAGETSKERIIDELAVEFGEAVRTTPPKSGFDLVAWLVPAIAVALGLAAIPVVTRSWARRRAGPAADRPPSAEEARRLDEELRRRA